LRGTLIAGVDGCRGGWLVALWAPPAGPTLHLAADWTAVVGLTEKCSAVAIDMPIGLPAADAQRPCDAQARARLGPRRSSVFPAPWRDCLQAREYSLELRARGMSIQTFHLLAKIRQLDDWIDPDKQGRAFEAHPELIWARLSGSVLLSKKRTLKGQAERRALLPFRVPESSFRRNVVAPDDIADALALAVCARDPIRPSSPERDARGLRMEIVF